MSNSSRFMSCVVIAVTIMSSGCRPNEETEEAEESQTSDDVAECGRAGDRDRTPEATHDVRVFRRLRELLPEMPEENVVWLADQYGNTAINIVQQHGLRGAEVIFCLGEQGVAVMRQYPNTFEEISKRLDGPTSAVFLVFMHDHFEDLAKCGGLPKLLDLFEKMPEEAKVLGKNYPEAMPFLALAPKEVCAALKQHPETCLVCLPVIDLSQGPDGLRQVARLITTLGARAAHWVHARGLDGLLLADSFPTFVDYVPPMDLPVFLQVLSENQDDIATLVAAGKEQAILAAFERLCESDKALPSSPATKDGPRQGDWLNLACIDPHTIRFVVEKGNVGLRVVHSIWAETASTGITLPSLLYDGYGLSESQGKLHENAWQAFVQAHGASRERETFQMLSLMLQNQAQDAKSVHPRAQRFRQLLGRLDYRVVRYLAAAEGNPGLTSQRYARLEDRGLYELDSQDNSTTSFVEMLPLYDTVHLGWILAQGYTPTQGEVLFAGVDVAFTAWDVATLGGGHVASCTVKTGLKTGAREGFREGAEAIGKNLTKVAAKNELKLGSERATKALLARLAKSPKVAMETARKGLYKDLRVAAEYAEHSAIKRRIPMKLMRYVMVQWTANVAIAKSLGEVADLAARSEGGLWAEKTKEALLYLSRIQETPLRGTSR